MSNIHRVYNPTCCEACGETETESHPDNIVSCKKCGKIIYMYKMYHGDIETLSSDEVFVFGTNGQGFHGAGAAGWATFNEKGNVWRQYKYDTWPNGTKGKWNVKGIARGFMQGEIGQSYGIQTVTFPGAKRSVSLQDVKKQIRIFKLFAEENGNLGFYVSFGGPGLNGYSTKEMASVWQANWPPNVFFKPELTRYF